MHGRVLPRAHGTAAAISTRLRPRVVPGWAAGEEEEPPWLPHRHLAGPGVESWKAPGGGADAARGLAAATACARAAWTPEAALPAAAPAASSGAVPLESGRPRAPTGICPGRARAPRGGAKPLGMAGVRGKGSPPFPRPLPDMISGPQGVQPRTARPERSRDKEADANL